MNTGQRSPSCCSRGPWPGPSTPRLSANRVMATAKTPSLNASSRPRVTCLQVGPGWRNRVQVGFDPLLLRVVTVHALTRPVSEGQVFIQQVRLRGQQFIESQFRMAADSQIDNAQPEPRHRLVVAFGAAVMRGEVTDSLRDDFRCLFESKPADLDPGQAEVIAVVEALVGDLVRVKSCYKRFIGRRHAR